MAELAELAELADEAARAMRWTIAQRTDRSLKTYRMVFSIKNRAVGLF
jgi:hypothetical protein